MIDFDYFQLMAKYNRWMNENIFAACAEIPDDDRHRDMDAFFGSIHDTLDHIFYGDQAWMNRFTGRPVGVAIGEELHADFTGLRRDREKMDAFIIAWCDKLDDAWLQENFEYTSNVDGETRVLPAWVLVTHMFNHQTHHRGQVTTLMKQLGYDPGITDLPWLPALAAEDKPARPAP